MDETSCRMNLISPYREDLRVNPAAVLSNNQEMKWKSATLSSTCSNKSTNDILAKNAACDNLEFKIMQESIFLLASGVVNINTGVESHKNPDQRETWLEKLCFILEKEEFKETVRWPQKPSIMADTDNIQPAIRDPNVPQLWACSALPLPGWICMNPTRQKLVLCVTQHLEHTVSYIAGVTYHCQTAFVSAHQSLLERCWGGVPFHGFVCLGSRTSRRKLLCLHREQIASEPIIYPVEQFSRR